MSPPDAARGSPTAGPDRVGEPALIRVPVDDERNEAIG